jgi:hypothetical protein
LQVPPRQSTAHVAFAAQPTWQVPPAQLTAQSLDELQLIAQVSPGHERSQDSLGPHVHGESPQERDRRAGVVSPSRTAPPSAPSPIVKS